MPEERDEDILAKKPPTDEFEEAVIKVRRCAKVVKGGKRFSFNAMVVVGNKAGRVGYGYGKANDVQFAIQKAVQDAKANLIQVPIKETTIPHEIRSKFGATDVFLKPACRGTGLKAGAATRAVLELAGIRDALSKVYGSTNAINVVKAVIQGLTMLRPKEKIEQLRSLKQDESDRGS
jgi:small subunit ribosomal protein S5